MTDADIEGLRAIREPIEQARRATELIRSCEARMVELGEVRLAAIERAKIEYDLTYTALAERIGLTKGRLTQIRQAGAQGRQASERGHAGVATTP
jgi:predicted nucleic acid-binding protein